ncbi:MAG: ABC transporter ATP-binding protein, partial [Actinomycetota bacterium]|nr:ABC transporter ATP-binding protein [Actinomycetota bacterium]
MLVPLLRQRLAPYRSWLVAVVALQFVGVLAMLYLPSLNASIIDDGVVPGHTALIWRVGGVRLGVPLVQIVCSGGAAWLGARTATAFGRDLRRDLFQRVGTFSTREVQEIGAPAL